MKFPENRKAVSELGIDLMGFILYPKSKRFVGDLTETEKTRLFQTTIPKVGVFVNEDHELIVISGKQYELDYIQLHGTETVEFCCKIKQEGFKVIKAFGVDESFDFQITDLYSEVTDFLLFDTKTLSHGGSGKKFNWEKLAEYNGEIPFLLSGGIKPDDAETIRLISHPKLAGVDLNSGFEDQPGLKNISLLQSFIEKLKS
ncbi:MAG: phosphoribosylanthranilate isomerase [Prolixibacteraceae bacterium]|nr:phosphoribosylanthranilate isomerase [Prolixibacteraceae bacterium]